MRGDRGGQVMFEFESKVAASHCYNKRKIPKYVVETYYLEARILEKIYVIFE